jgi:hypothetical protein
MTEAWTYLTPEEYAQQFPSLFTQSAFRLEQLDHYSSPDEAEAFARYLAGEPDDLSWRQPWLDLVREAVGLGKSMTRVHVVTEPWTPYIAFELWTYEPAVVAGEDIRIIVRDGSPSIDHDFWLVDSTVARMDYDPEGVWRGLWLTDHASIVATYKTWRSAIVSASVPLTTYLNRSTSRRRSA